MLFRSRRSIGVGGLAAACALSKAGHRVRVLERGSIAAQSGGVRVPPNLSKVLRRWVSEDELHRLATRCVGTPYHHRESPALRSAPTIPACSPPWSGQPPRRTPRFARGLLAHHVAPAAVGGHDAMRCAAPVLIGSTCTPRAPHDARSRAACFLAGASDDRGPHRYRAMRRVTRERAGRVGSSGRELSWIARARSSLIMPSWLRP